MATTTRKKIEMISGTLWVILVLLYLLAKLDFFAHYGGTDYVSQHSLYWAAMAAVAFLIWIASKFSNHQ